MLDELGVKDIINGASLLVKFLVLESVLTLRRSFSLSLQMEQQSLTMGLMRMASSI